VVIVVTANAVSHVFKGVRKPLAAIWGWLTSQSAPMATLIGIIGVAIALAGLIAVLVTSGGPSPKHPVTLRRSALSLVSSDGKGVAANGDSGRPALSASGRFVVFTSAAANLAPVKFPAGYGYHNIYVKDRETGTIQWVSRGRNDQPPNGESQFPAICPAGRFVAFASDATNLAAVGPRISGPKWRVYVHDDVSRRTYLVSMAVDGQDSNGQSVNPQFNADCTRLVFESTSSDLVTDDANGPLTCSSGCCSSAGRS
jgi:TolB protein